MSTISSRRVLIVGVLGVAACVGAVVRHVSEEGSTAHALGTLFMVMWVPIVGNIIAFAIRKWRTAALPPHAFAADAPFEPQAQVELVLTTAAGLADGREGGLLPFLLVVGSEGFVARAQLSQAPAVARPLVAALQLLSPTAALPKLAASGTFKLVQGRSVVGQGRLLGAADDGRRPTETGSPR